MLRKIIIYFFTTIVLIATAYFLFVYYASYSKGDHSGELIKFSNKGYLFKTWEGEMSQGTTGMQTFKFSVLDKDKKVIEDLKELQGHFIKVTCMERYRTFPWWGDSNYFVTDVQKEESPIK